MYRWRDSVQKLEAIQSKTNQLLLLHWSKPADGSIVVSILLLVSSTVSYTASASNNFLSQPHNLVHNRHAVVHVVSEGLQAALDVVLKSKK